MDQIVESDEELDSSHSSGQPESDPGSEPQPEPEPEPHTELPHRRSQVPARRRRKRINSDENRRGHATTKDDSRDGETRKEWYHKYRREPQRESDATPRLDNTGGNGGGGSGSGDARFTSFASSINSESIPPIPFHSERSMRPHTFRIPSQSSLASFLSKGNKTSTITTHQDAQDDISEPSLHLNALYGPSTPTSNASSYVRRTPDGPGIRKISMDGAIRDLPLTSAPPETDASSGRHSIPESRPNSPSKRTREAMHKSYFTKTQEMFQGEDSFHSNTSHQQYDEDPSNDLSMDADDENFDPLFCFNYKLPTWFTSLLRSTPSINSISRCLVNCLPCFWCTKNSSGGATSDRSVLLRLNVLVLFMTLTQLACALWLVFVILILDDKSGVFKGFAPHFWNSNGAIFSIGILAVALIAVCSCTIRVVKEVDFGGAIRYLWIVLWILPFELFFNIGIYDYYNVTEVWIRQWWLNDQMSWFREYFCAEGTAETTCMVPILGGEEFESELAWCLAKFNTTECSDVRDDAQDWMNTWMLTYYTGVAGWTSILLGVLLLMVHALERIITRPIVQKSRESNVPAWLSLPTLANAVIGSVFLFAPSSLITESENGASWIGILYLVVSALFFGTAMIGWFLSTYTIRNHGDKQTKSVAVIVMIFLMAANVLLLATIFVTSILFAGSLINAPIDDTTRGEIACQVSRDSCTMCQEGVNAADRCPEWTLGEVTRILQSQLKQSAALAAIFIVYAISILRFGITMRKHLSLYQIDYV